jgi:hypothetical protein
MRDVDQNVLAVNIVSRLPPSATLLLYETAPRFQEACQRHLHAMIEKYEAYADIQQLELPDRFALVRYENHGIEQYMKTRLALDQAPSREKLLRLHRLFYILRKLRFHSTCEFDTYYPRTEIEARKDVQAHIDRVYREAVRLQKQLSNKKWPGCRVERVQAAIHEKVTNVVEITNWILPFHQPERIGKITGFCDTDTEVSARYDDGEEVHNLKCGKRAEWQLLYA